MARPVTVRPRAVALALAAATALCVAGPARGQLLAPTSPVDPSPYLDWPALVPPLPGPVTQPTATDCIDGAHDCIDRTIAEMQHRLDSVVPVCDDRAVFSLAYLRVTEDVRKAIHAGVFTDPKWLQSEDRVFARMYFDAYDNYAAGRVDRVPRAWRLTFDAERKRQVNAFGEFFMSMNAHINRDFPFMLASIGLRRPDGSSRKPDHDAYNRRLAALYEPVIHEVAARFDRTADDADVGIIDNEQAFAVLQSWREGVWRNAEALVSAPTPAARALVANEIEAYADSVAVLLRETFAYRVKGPRAARDAWCAAHNGQHPAATRAKAKKAKKPRRHRHGRRS